MSNQDFLSEFFHEPSEMKGIEIERGLGPRIVSLIGGGRIGSSVFAGPILSMHIFGCGWSVGLPIFRRLKICYGFFRWCDMLSLWTAQNGVGWRDREDRKWVFNPLGGMEDIDDALRRNDVKAEWIPHGNIYTRF